MLRFARNGPSSFAFLAIALLTGLLGGYMLASPERKDGLCIFPFDAPSYPNNHAYPEPSQNTVHPHQSASGSLLASDDLDLEALRSIVTGTRGYYARDFSMGLGWNNVSYSASQRLNVALIHFDSPDALYHRDRSLSWFITQPHCHNTLLYLRSFM